MTNLADLATITCAKGPATGATMPDLSNDGRWLAQIDLSFSKRHDRTVMISNHRGPLRTQKALYPEHDGYCHAVIIHPPSGIAAGDDLVIQIDCLADAGALVTTPGAAKWYGASDKGYATQKISMSVNGALEWLPQETIVYDHANAESDFNINLNHQASMIGWDTLIFGRSACNEKFDTGRFFQRLRLNIQKQPIWEERLLLVGNDPLFQSPVGLSGHHAFSTLWAVRSADHAWTNSDLELLREKSPTIAWTQIHAQVVLGRIVGVPLALRKHLHQAWQVLRPIVHRRDAITPRLWNT